MNKYSSKKCRYLAIWILLLLLNAYSLAEEQILDDSWGFFKPHLLLSLTQRSLNPLNFGLIYSNSKNANIQKRLRWGFGNTKDGINAFYSAHNGKDYVEHTINDEGQQIRIESAYIGFTNQKSWKMRLTVENLDRSKESLSNVYLYLSSSSFEENRFDSINAFSFLKTQGEEMIRIGVSKKTNHQTSEISQELRIYEESVFKNSEPSLVEAVLNSVSSNQAWDMQYLLRHSIKQDGTFEAEPDFRSDAGHIDEQEQWSSSNHNVALIRVSNSWRSSISLILEFGRHQTQQEAETNQSSNKPECGELLNSYQNCFDVIVAERSKQYNSDIISKFGTEQFDVIKNVLSNLLGGLVFYHGTIVNKNSVIRSNLPKTVFSASPSRKTFPRAFLWDEGFHLSIICLWNEELCRSSLNSWMGLQDVLGYIPREQVRTQEISQYVPDGFRSQDANEANPPTLLFPFLMLLKTNTLENIAFIEKSLRPLEKWFKWMQATQSHSDNQAESPTNSAQIPLSFRWKCKNGECKQGNFLGSGLDDYPRQDKGTLLQQHLDLQCWMVFFADSLAQITQALGLSKSGQYKHIKQSLINQLKNDFIDLSDHLYKDVVLKGQEQQHLTHDGYITLFPMLFDTVPANSQQFEAMLDLISDPHRLWSDFGIRSLSLEDPFYGLGDNYWRGAIWMPLNYLILRSLKINYFEHERARNIYTQLRENLIKNIVTNWESSSGQLFETYNPETGKGQRAFPFNGWTSLIILVISEKY